jgi:carboxylesterase type B
MQFLWGDDGAFDDGSEDCLVLNVFVNLQAAAVSSQPLPVAVFIHGGAYISGMSHLPLYDGVEMVDFWDGKGILVTSNYRLNAFGFLGSDALRGRDTERGSTGNYGIQDQRLAFEWVRENIGKTCNITHRRSVLL